MAPLAWVLRKFLFCQADASPEQMMPYEQKNNYQLYLRTYEQVLERVLCTYSLDFFKTGFFSLSALGTGAALRVLASAGTPAEGVYALTWL